MSILFVGNVLISEYIFIIFSVGPKFARTSTKERGASVMKIAITIWETRISPVFDSARNLLVAEAEETGIIDRKSLPFDARLFNRFLLLLLELEVKVLICGALCEGPAKVLEAHGIEVFSFLTGEAEEVLACYLQGGDMSRFSLPGCRWGMCRRKKENRKKRNLLMKEDGICLDLISGARRGKGRQAKKDDAAGLVERTSAVEKDEVAAGMGKAVPIKAKGGAKERPAVRDAADKDNVC